MAMKDSEKRGKWQDDSQGKWKKTRPQPPELPIEVAPKVEQKVEPKQKVKPAKRKVEEETEKEPVFQQKPRLKVKKAALAIKDEEPAETFQRKYKRPVGKFAKQRRSPAPRTVEPIPRQITEVVDDGRVKKFIKRSAELGKVAKTALATIAQRSMDAIRQQGRAVAATPTARIMAVMAQRLASNPRAVKGFKTPALRGRRAGR